MNKKPLLTAAIAALVASTSATAQEPLALFGIPFAAPLSIQECQTRMESDILSREKGATRLNYVHTSPETACYTQALKDIGKPLSDGEISIRFPITEQPLMGRVTGRVVGGNLEMVTIHTRGIRTQDMVFNDLVQKFGEPSTLSRPSMQNRMGATFQTIDAVWNLENGVQAVFVSTITSLDEGIVMIMTPTGKAAQAEARTQQARQLGGRKL